MRPPPCCSVFLEPIFPHALLFDFAQGSVIRKSVADDLPLVCFGFYIHGSVSLVSSLPSP